MALGRWGQAESALSDADRELLFFRWRVTASTRLGRRVVRRTFRSPSLRIQQAFPLSSRPTTIPVVRGPDFLPGSHV